MTSEMLLPLSSPLKVMGGNRQHDFGSLKYKASSGKALGEHVGELIISSYIFNLKVPTKHTILNEVVVHFNMLRPGMKDRIGGNCKSKNIMTPQLRRSGKKDAQIL